VVVLELGPKLDAVGEGLVGLDGPVALKILFVAVVFQLGTRRADLDESERGRGSFEVVPELVERQETCIERETLVVA
jgi:hypothetical protein